MQVSDSYKRIAGLCTSNPSQVSIRKEFSVKSGCDIKLSELEQQLNVAEAKCGSLKSQMDYMKILYQGVQPEKGEIDKIADIGHQQKESSSLKLSATSVPEVSQPEDTADSEDVLYTTFLQQIRKIQETTNKGPETEKHSSYTSPSLTVRLPEIAADSITENVDFDTKEENGEKEHLSELAVERKKFPPVDSFHFRPVTQTSVPDKDKAYSKFHVDDTTNQHPYQKYLAEYSAGLQHDILNLKTSIERLVTTDNENLQQRRNSRVEDDAKELILKDSQSVESVHEVKHRKIVKTEKKQKIVSSNTMNKKSSDCKVDEIVVTRIKRKKGKIRNSVSKSTVMTKETNSTVRRELKKRKHKNTSFVSRLSKKPSIPRIQQNRSEVVEIFHNASLKSGSVSVVSSRHAVLYPRPKNPNKKLHHPQTAQEKRHSPPNHIFQADEQFSRKISQRDSKQTVQQEIKPEPVKTTVVQKVAERENQSMDSEVVENCSTVMNKNNNFYKNAQLDANYYDPMAIRNYELPTLASKLKRSNRSYFHRFNFKNIPFVVGTSVTPSHNLGLNIQQVLSIMKTRQPTVGGITPLLIRKVSRGMKPVSVLMELDNQNFKLNQDVANEEKTYDPCGTNDIINETASLRFMKQTPMAQSLRSVPNAQNYFPKSSRGSKIIHEDNRNENTHPNLDQQTVSQMKMLNRFTSQRSVKLHLNAPKGESNIGDFQNMNSLSSQNKSKGIRGVLIKLHDQFEEMNTKYEKLQEKAEKSNDKTLAKEIVALEKELNAKEEEINAVVNLYKEVMTLKQQMRMLQEKNSFVCFSTEIPSLSKTNSPIRAATNFPPFTPRRGNAFGRKPSTSIRLAGLLRQIQMFQKQLALAP